jgi:hypothetical protein
MIARVILNPRFGYLSYKVPRRLDLIFLPNSYHLS